MKTQAIGTCALILAATAGSAVAAPVQWMTADGGNGHYYEYVASALTWTAALTAADAFTLPGHDGYLATATSAAENQFMLNIVLANVTGTASRRTWLAGTDREVEGVWKWAAGPEAGQVFWNGGPPAAGGAAPPGAFASWLAGEPNSSTAGEDYLSAFPRQNVFWNDTVDNNPTLGYIVEYSAVAVPEPAAWALMILGFGGVGTVIRRRARVSAVA